MKALFVRRYLMCWPLILAPLALASCGGAAPEEGGAEAEPVALVRTAPALAGAASETVELYGTAEAGPEGTRALSVVSEAIVSAIHAPAGTAVRAGDAVITLRPSPRAQADLVRAANEAKVARAAYARAMRLRADGLVGDGEVEAARGAVGTADAALIAARGTGTLRAPLAGTVQGLTVQGLALRVGDLVPAGTTIAAIAGAGERRARFGVDPAMASRLHPGQPIRITAAGGDLLAETTVLGVDPAGDPATRLASVYARVPQGLGIGQALKASVGLGVSRAALTIPYEALLDDAGKSFVFVVSGGIAHRRAVEPGSSSPGVSSTDRIAILHGLQAGERVVTEGGTALEDGMKTREDQPISQSQNQTRKAP